ncbi:MAG: lamin tail domain-containing protein [Bacteroidales bacterium]|nr:lamin tail domain-containing protein [Bacteroidales bacterium]MBN2818848.1 lamin tail domain-containing protein [Bacteroidales bacterium]
MKKTFQLFLLCQISVWIYSQELKLDFEDYNISSWEQSRTGGWHLDSLNALSGRFSLHHNYDNPESGMDMISFQHDDLWLDSSLTTWNYSVRYDYNPSSSNNWAIWIASDRSQEEMYPEGVAQGLILGVNYSGSDDYIKLWNQKNGVIEEIVNTAYNWQEKIETGSIVKLKAERTFQGVFNIFIGKPDGEWDTIGSGQDTLINRSEYTGIYYKYSSTQDRKLWVDEVHLSGYLQKDIFPPKIESVETREYNMVILTFNELIDTNIIPAIRLNRNISPERTSWKTATQLVCKFTQVFSEQNLLEVYGLIDIKGNTAELISYSFDFYIPQPYDIVITEVLPDPTPSYGLPESEYIELFNRSEHVINIESWNLCIDKNKIEFPNAEIYPGKYYLITDKSTVEDYPDSVSVIGINKFPALPNDGTELILRDKYGTLIFAVDYSEFNYITEYKQDGGWSFEMADINNPCIISENWQESKNALGGTPGYVNSILANLIDTTPPGVMRTVSLGSNRMKIFFSEPMDSLSLIETGNYSISVADISLINIVPTTPFFKDAEIVFSNNIIADEIISMQLSGGIMDCSGNQLTDTCIYFGLAKNADSSDILLNEVLFEASDSVPEFIELYNNSNKVIDLKSFSIGFSTNQNEILSGEIMLCSSNLQLLPNEYIVFTGEKQQLITQYPNSPQSQIIEVNTWKNLSNEGGFITLLDSWGNVMDKAIYGPEIQFSLLNETRGVSLEKIAFKSDGSRTDSWHSASHEVNYATPALVNSQAMLINSETIGNVSIRPDEFSPNNDGFEDYAVIYYKFEKPGYLASIYVFSSDGLLISTIANNVLFGASGEYTWEGTDDSGNKIPMGYYIVYIEAIHPEGEVFNYKKAVLVLP